MRAKAWKGATFGIRVGKANAKRFFDPEKRIVEIEMDGRLFRFRLSDTFWTTCPEVRGVAISQWLRKHGLDRWPVRRPPEFELTPIIDKHRFKLSTKT